MIITGELTGIGSSAVSPLSKIMVDAIMKLNITLILPYTCEFPRMPMKNM